MITSPDAARPAEPAADGRAKVRTESRDSNRWSYAFRRIGSSGSSNPPSGARTGRRSGPRARERARRPGIPGGRKGVCPEGSFDSANQRVERSSAPKLPDFSKWGDIETRPLDSVRRKTAEQMSLAWSLIPHVTQHDLADITELEAFRTEREGKGPKLTVTAFALKAHVAVALCEFPQFQLQPRPGRGPAAHPQALLSHRRWSVDTERGLLVPVLRDVNAKNIRDLGPGTGRCGRRKPGRRKSLPTTLRGGTFTITNLGGIGGTGFSPIVNYPEVAILGMSRGRLQPAIHGGAVASRLLLPLGRCPYDHRVIDGAAAARFARRVAEMLEQPLLMLLDV